MPSSIHKVLIRGADTIQNAAVAIGMMSVVVDNFLILTKGIIFIFLRIYTIGDIKFQMMNGQLLLGSKENVEIFLKKILK